MGASAWVANSSSSTWSKWVHNHCTVFHRHLYAIWEYVYVYMYTIYMYIMSIDCSSERSIIFYSPTTSFLFFFFHVYIMYVLTYTWFYIFGQTQQRRLSSESFVLLDFCMLIFTQAHAASQSYRDSYSSKIILCYFFFVLYPTALYKY